MHKATILYDNILSLLNAITEGPDTETYYNSLLEDKKSDYIVCIENIQQSITDIKSCKLTKSFYSYYENLNTLITDF